MTEYESPVRESVYRYQPHLTHVSVNKAACDELAETLVDDESFSLPEWSFPCFISPDAPREDVLDFLFLINTVNFAFRDFDTGEKFAADVDGEEWRGAFGMIGCFKRAYEDERPILDGEYLADLSMNDVEELFQPSNGVSMPLLEERHDILTTVGERLVEEHDGHFHSFLETTGGSLYGDHGIARQLVSSFPSFRDEWEVETMDGSLSVRFDKRAQLAVAMAYARLDDFHLSDPEAFTVFADYNLPNILRYYDALEYSPGLEEWIEAGKVMPAGARYEIEMRAATIIATDRILDRVNELTDESVTAAHLDSVLFGIRDAVETPVHRARTTSY